MMERIEKMRVSDEALDLVFRKARTYNAWLHGRFSIMPSWKDDGQPFFNLSKGRLADNFDPGSSTSA
jgi:hypothetical protein